MNDAFKVGTVCDLLSSRRFAPYLQSADGDASMALDLYAWSGRMSSAAFQSVAHLEVFLRNAIDRVMADYTGESDRGLPWFLCEPPMTSETAAAVATVRERLRPLGRDSRDQIVTGLSFGFWSGMLGPRYEDLWRAALRHAFPGSSGARKQVASEVEAIRKFRNRLAHHDSMLGVDVPFEMRRVHKVVQFISNDAASWLESIDASREMYAMRPIAPLDTVVVAAKDAWPFYQSNFAYVCQPGRWFQPIERVAFYADQEVKREVPRILYRRDNVPWSEHEALTLAASADKYDRKIAAVIQAGMTAGWTEGKYQVFLLSRPGDPQHRQLPHNLSHETAGRGSAFVQRQRYVSLHSLETSSTTAEL